MNKDRRGNVDYFRRVILKFIVWLALLLRIPEVPGLNLGTKTGYPD
jgi:hypothetical protein